MRTSTEGHTELSNGLRVEKDSPAIETLGAVDELKGWIGVLTAFSEDDELTRVFSSVQNDLSDLGAQIKSSSSGFLSGAYLSRIEQSIDRLHRRLKEGGPARPALSAASVAFIHVAYAVCHRAERRLLTLMTLSNATGVLTLRMVDGSIRTDFGLPYLNGLSKFISLAGRVAQ